VDIAALLPHLTDLRLQEAEETGDRIVVDARAQATSSPCPSCQQLSTSVHSSYRRCIADRPIGDRPVTRRLRVRRFRCRNSACPRRTFVEQHPSVARRSARRSVPLQQELQDIGLTLGGRPGQRCAHVRRMRVSRTALLRLVRCLPEPAMVTPPVLGIDDFALKRGHRYGTLLVDLEQHRVVDVLAERSAETVAQWLQTHGPPMFVCRDRGGEYAAAARQAAPTAIQVADRFHLMRNGSDVLERILVRHAAALCASVVQDAQAPAAEDTSDVRSMITETTAARPMTEDPRRWCRHARYEWIVALHAEGRSNAAIAATVDVSRPTVRTYLRAGSFTEWPARRTLLSAGTE